MEHVRHRLPEQDGARRPALRHSLRDQVLDALRGALVAGELAPGTVCSAPALAARFGVSATPVREAMQQLVREGTVEVVQNRGFRITARSGRDLAELAEVRALLEVPVLLRLAAESRPGDWAALCPLARHTQETAATGDRAAYAAADRAFHTALLCRSGNAQLAAVAAELHGRAQWPPVPVPDADRLTADAAGHVALLDALTRRDLPAVESLTRAHLRAAPPSGPRR